MKIRTMLVATILTLGSIMTVSGLVMAGAQEPDAASPRGNNKRVYLECKNYGGQQDVSKNPDIINTTKKPIPAGKKLYWTASDGDKGSIVLETALAPKGKVGVTGKAGQAYTCQAWYMK